MSDEKNQLQSEGWKQWSANVKDSLDKLEVKVDRLEDKITKHREESLVEVSTLKAKAGIIGMIAGFVVSTFMSVIIGLLVWQLTVGTQKIVPYQLDTTDKPEQGVSYIMPSKEDDFLIKKIRGDNS